MIRRRSRHSPRSVPIQRSPIGVQRTPPLGCHCQLVQPARPRRHRRPESGTGARSTPPGVVGHMLGQQAVDDVGGSRQLGYQGVPLIHDHSTMDARSQPRERTRPCRVLAWCGPPHCGSSQGVEIDRRGGRRWACTAPGRRGYRAAGGVGGGMPRRPVGYDGRATVAQPRRAAGPVRRRGAPCHASPPAPVELANSHGPRSCSHESSTSNYALRVANHRNGHGDHFGAHDNRHSLIQDSRTQDA